jgi:hypothetical protein
MEISELCTPGRDACGRGASLYGGEDRAHTLQYFCFLSPALTKPARKCKGDKSPSIQSVDSLGLTRNIFQLPTSVRVILYVSWQFNISKSDLERLGHAMGIFLSFPAYPRFGILQRRSASVKGSERGQAITTTKATPLGGQSLGRSLAHCPSRSGG